jgi:hypothetical protein
VEVEMEVMGRRRSVEVRRERVGAMVEDGWCGCVVVRGTVVL